MKGRIMLIGIGPGGREHMTPRAVEAIMASEVIVGYGTYIDLIKDLAEGKEIVARGMMEEVERAKVAVERALQGKRVGVISSGDPGIYAMAPILFEYLRENAIDLEVEVIPGITAANAAAALLGSPLGHDFAVISLSDLLTPLETIQARVEAAARGDFVIVLYNPRSSRRLEPLERAVGIISRHRLPETPVGIVRSATRDGEAVKITTLEKLLGEEIDMLTVLIVGNSETYAHKGKMVTPRGYRVKYALRDG